MLNATILRKIKVTKELVIFHIVPDGGFSSFFSGQYVALGLMGDAPRMEGAPIEEPPPAPHKLIKRAYSIGSSPNQKEYLEFYIAIVPEGTLTSRLAVLKEGDRVYVAPKITGTFIIEDIPSHKNLILVSTGTGIAPFMAMIRTEQTWTEGRSISILHGVRFPEDLAYAEELISLQNRKSNFAYFPIVSRAGDGYTGRKGRVQEIFKQGELKISSETDHVLLCGNPAMVDELEFELINSGFTLHSKKISGNLHLEKYW